MCCAACSVRCRCWCAFQSSTPPASAGAGRARSSRRVRSGQWRCGDEPDGERVPARSVRREDLARSALGESVAGRLLFRRIVGPGTELRRHIRGGVDRTDKKGCGGPLRHGIRIEPIGDPPRLTPQPADGKLRRNRPTRAENHTSGFVQAVDRTLSDHRTLVSTCSLTLGTHACTADRRRAEWLWCSTCP